MERSDVLSIPGNFLGRVFDLAGNDPELVVAWKGVVDEQTVAVLEIPCLCQKLEITVSDVEGVRVETTGPATVSVRKEVIGSQRAYIGVCKHCKRVHVVF